MKIKYLLLFLISVIQVQAFSQKKWTLEDCINYAHANNLQIKRQELQAKVADVNLLQSYTNILPDLNGNISRNYGFGRQIDPFTNDFILNNSISDNYSVTSNISLFNGLQNYNNIKSNKYASLAAIQNVEKEKIENTFNISSAYLEILFQKELLEVAKNQKEVTVLQVDRTQKLVDAGNVAKGDLLEIQAQLANENLNITNTQNQLNLSILNLSQLLDLDSTSNFDIVVPDTIDPNIATDIPSVSMVYNNALEYLPHVKSAEYLLKSFEKQLAVQKGKRSPMLYLSGSIYTGYSDQRTLLNTDDFSEQEIGYIQGNPSQIVVSPSYGVSDYSYSQQFSDNIAQSLSIGLSIPILNRWEVNNGISRARIRMEDSKFELDQVKQQLYKNIQQAHNDAISAREKYNSAIEAVISNKESFHYTQQKFNVGMVNSVEYNIAKNNYIKAESDLLQAKYEYIFAVKILDFYRGIPITL
ncbi:MAG: TolC family protein [Bacteroidales bacterium]|nr:TolC family protein [Bacteroidales bacterium]